MPVVNKLLLIHWQIHNPAMGGSFGKVKVFMCKSLPPLTVREGQQLA